jgi:hypothetical protein
MKTIFVSLIAQATALVTALFALAALSACDAPPDSLTAARSLATGEGCPACGNGIVEEGEQCEPPGTAACTATCQLVVVAPPSCGDGVINSCDEQCDPPAAAGSYSVGCSATCQIAPTLCSTCEAGKCDALYGDATAWGCQNVTGAARASCEALVACIRTTHCAAATSDAQACYCGSAADLACLTGQANGACKAQYEAAAGSVDAGTIASLFTDPSSAVGLADNQITCDADTSTPSCTAACPL